MRIRLYLQAIVLLLLVSCNKELDNNSTPISIEVSMAQDNHQSRSVVIGNKFSNGNTYGLFICKAGLSGYPSFSFKTNNIRATATSNPSIWNYNYEGVSSSFGAIYLNFLMGEEGDFYAYAPWIAGVTTPDKIPYTSGGTNANQIDLMYAVENIGPANKGKSPEGEESTKKVSVQFGFKHVLSLLRFEFKLKNEDAGIVLNTLRVCKKAGATTPLYKSGIFNSITGDITSKEEVDSVMVTEYNLGVNSVETASVANFLLMPTSLSGEDLEIVFTFNGRDIYSKFTIPHTISEFKAGYRYTFEFVLDNYINFNGVTIDKNWTTLLNEEIEI